jgi:hypothetical protein
MSECHSARSNDHEHAKNTFYGVEMLRLFSLGIGFDSPNRYGADQRYADT